MFFTRVIGSVVAASLLFAGGTSFADTICVPDDYETIQAAIDAAVDGDEICVRPGTYNETIDFIGKAVRLYSTDGPEVTVIDATGIGGSVATCSSGEGPDTILEGFTITGGDAERGGGMHIRYGNPTVTNCTFSGNTGGVGGGGMYNEDSSPTITNCTFIWNTGGFGGGGMLNSHGSPTVTDCTFSGNNAGSGGGMYFILRGDGRPIVTDCTFEGNIATSTWEYAGGGGIYFDGTDLPTVTNCTFIGNTAGGPGGGIVIGESSTVTHCTFIDNDSVSGAEAIASWGRDVTVANCILWNGGDEIWNDNGSTIVVTYSDVQGGWPGIGNIDTDPLCDADGRPQAGSPCIDAGANNAVPADTLDLDNDGDTDERLPFDHDGNPRFADDLDRDDTGCGLPVVVDMGAFEYQGVPVETVIVGDVDGDGAVGMTDVIEVLMAWGECDPECCLADVDFTWRVDAEDLMLVLANWG